jgi:hypothetical protein
MDNPAPLLQLVPDNDQQAKADSEAVSGADQTFADFWTLYPKHEAKKDARKSWGRLSQRQQLAAIIAIADWRQVWEFQGRDSRVIPLAATWLNGERWEDEIPAGLIVYQASHKPAPPEQEPTRSAGLPDRVKAMLAKLRKP